MMYAASAFQGRQGADSTPEAVMGKGEREIQRLLERLGVTSWSAQVWGPEESSPPRPPPPPPGPSG